MLPIVEDSDLSTFLTVRSGKIMVQLYRRYSGFRWVPRPLRMWVNITKAFSQKNTGNNTKFEGITLINHPAKIFDIIKSVSIDVSSVHRFRLEPVLVPRRTIPCQKNLHDDVLVHVF